MNEIQFEYTERNVVLTLDNTERLYKLALEVTDFEIDNNQISNLTSAILREVDNQYFPSYSEVQTLKNVVANQVKQLQGEL